MIRVGLTGGLGCGKTTVGNMMVGLGAHMVQADAIAHELMSPGKPVFDAVVKHFGREIVQTDGTLDRKKLAEQAFGKGRVAELNAIVHPAVIEQQNIWMDEIGRREPDAIVIVEAALILEAGVKGRFDKLVVVTCDEAAKAERFARRVAGTAAGEAELEAARAEARRRIAAQIPDAEKIKVADHVIDNSGTLEETRRQVASMMEKLRQG